MDTVNYGGVEVLDLNGNKSESYIETEKTLDSTLRYAHVILVPEIGSNTTNPPIKLAYDKIKREVDKVMFKHEQSNWKLFYGMMIDTLAHGCDTGGKPGVMLQIPYVPFNEDRAKNLLVEFVKEICALSGIERAVLNYNINTGFVIECRFDDENNRCLETFYTADVREVEVAKNVSCTIDAGLVPAGIELQKAIDHIGGTLNPRGMEYYQAGMFIYSSTIVNASCMMQTCNIQEQNISGMPIGQIFEESINKELNLSELVFTNYTVL